MHMSHSTILTLMDVIMEEEIMLLSLMTIPFYLLINLKSKITLVQNLCFM